MDAYTEFDSLGMFLSGGSNNINPSDSLGGKISVKEVRGLSPIWNVPVQALAIENATVENEEGEASITVFNDTAQYTPPDGLAGTAVSIAEGERKIVQGSDSNKALRIYRESGKAFDNGVATFKLVNVLNGVISMSNVEDDVRQSGGIHYRALFLKAFADVADVQFRISTTGQSTFAWAQEEPESDGTIQTISSDVVAPTGLSWTTSLLNVGVLLEGVTIGIWIRRTFPVSGVMAVEEEVSVHLDFKGGI